MWIFSWFSAGITAPCAVLAAAALIAATGCTSGGNYPVSGKVVDRQGQPIAGLEGSQIVFTLVDGMTSSVGEIKADGSFDVFTERPGDGAPPGQYQVHIPRRHIDPEHQAPQAIDEKYEKPETSGLQATVEAKTNSFEFKVDPAGRRS
jgi:hypothetical protein